MQTAELHSVSVCHDWSPNTQTVLWLFCNRFQHQNSFLLCCYDPKSSVNVLRRRLGAAGSPTFRQKTLWERLQMNETVCLLPSVSQDRVVIAVAYDCVEKMVYWTDITGPAISRARLSGGDISPVITTGQQTGSRRFMLAEAGTVLLLGNVPTLDLDRADEVLVEYLGQYSACLFCQVADKMMSVPWTSFFLIICNCPWRKFTSPFPWFWFWFCPLTEVCLFHPSSGLQSPEGIAIDHVARLLFWTDSMRDTVEVSQLDGSQRRVLFDTDLINPRPIVTNSAYGWVIQHEIGLTCWKWSLHSGWGLDSLVLLVQAAVLGGLEPRRAQDRDGQHGRDGAGRPGERRPGTSQRADLWHRQPAAVLGWRRWDAPDRKQNLISCSELFSPGGWMDGLIDWLTDWWVCRYSQGGVYGSSPQAEEDDRWGDPVSVRSRLFWKKPLLHRLEEVDARQHTADYWLVTVHNKQTIDR